MDSYNLFDHKQADSVTYDDESCRMVMNLNSLVKQLPNQINYQILLNFPPELANLINSFQQFTNQNCQAEPYLYQQVLAFASKFEIFDPSSIMQKRIEMTVGKNLNATLNKNKFYKKLCDEIVHQFVLMQDLSLQFV